MSNFERKFGKYAVRNLSLVLIACYVIGYIIELFAPSITSLLTLNPYAILHGQIWRLVTWVLIPPDSLDLFTIIMLLFYYNVGTSLEMTWHLSVQCIPVFRNALHHHRKLYRLRHLLGNGIRGGNTGQCGCDAECFHAV